MPLNKSRRGACSTRTTHPTFIKRLQLALASVGINNQMTNPYEFKTKGEMVVDCCKDKTKKEILLKLINASCSCAKRTHNSFWDKSKFEIVNTPIHHCGMCLPCLYRRVSLFINGLDETQQYGTDVFHGIKFDVANMERESSRDFRTLLDFLKQHVDYSFIRKELMIGGITDKEKLDNYIDLEMRTFQQIRAWVAANADDDIKKRAGIL